MLTNKKIKTNSVNPKQIYAQAGMKDQDFEPAGQTLREKLEFLECSKIENERSKDRLNLELDVVREIIVFRSHELSLLRELHCLALAE